MDHDRVIASPQDGGSSDVYEVDVEVLKRWQEARKEYLAARAALVSEIERQGWRPQPEAEHINIVFDRGPGPWPQQLTDVEDDQGHSIMAGQWLQRDDGRWVLRLQRC